MKPKIIFSLLATVLLSCTKFVELDPPKDQLTTKNVYNSDATAISAIAGLYITMANNGNQLLAYKLPLSTGLYSDELTNRATLLGNQQLYTNTLKAVDSSTNGLWNLWYNMIYQANAIIEGCELSGAISPAIKKQLIAEALFIRALTYFYLTNFYGDIPLLTSTDYEVNASKEKAGRSAVYGQIIDDLIASATDINVDYVALNSVSKTNDRIRPNKAAAIALLARVYLYTGKYQDAEAQATEIINQKALYDTVNVTKTFLMDSKEAIFQLAIPLPSSQNVNTLEGYNFILTAKPLTNLSRSSTISPRLLAAFEPGDLRRKNWIGSFTDATLTPNVTYYFPYKYRVQSSATITERTIVLRLSEQYLIRAEVRALQGNLAGAISDLDVIRKRAGLALISDTDPTITKSALLDKIMHERQVELFAEWGHRWMDIKRSSKVDEIMTPVCQEKGSTWISFKALWPIPQSETERNTKLSQNTGYN